MIAELAPDFRVLTKNSIGMRVIDYPASLGKAIGQLEMALGLLQQVTFPDDYTEGMRQRIIARCTEANAETKETLRQSLQIGREAAPAFPLGDLTEGGSL